jgi:hypothetical protein
MTKHEGKQGVPKYWTPEERADARAHFEAIAQGESPTTQIRPAVYAEWERNEQELREHMRMWVRSMTNPSPEQRARFEKWAEGKDLSNRPTELTYWAWEGWQAGEREALERAAEMVRERIRRQMEHAKRARSPYTAMVYSSQNYEAQAILELLERVEE